MQAGGQATWSSNKQAYITMDTDRRTDRQTDRKTDWQTDIQTERQTDTHTDGQTDRQTHSHTHTQTDRQTDKQTDAHRRTDKLTDWQTDRQTHTDGRTNRQTDRRGQTHYHPHSRDIQWWPQASASRPQKCRSPFNQSQTYRSKTRRRILRNVHIILIVSAVKVCKQCLQTASASEVNVQGR